MLAMAAACPMNLFADDDGFVVRMNNGTAEAFKFSETKKITFNADGFNVIDTQSKNVGTYLFEEVAKITFDNELTGIEQAISDGEDVMFRLSADRQSVEVSGIGADSVMRLHSITGTTVMSTASFNGSSVDISNLPEGIYILSINNKTFKFKK